MTGTASGFAPKRALLFTTFFIQALGLVLHNGNGVPHVYYGFAYYVFVQSDTGALIWEPYFSHGQGTNCRDFSTSCSTVRRDSLFLLLHSIDTSMRLCLISCEREIRP
jgi:hypothetical protein